MTPGAILADKDTGKEIIILLLAACCAPIAAS
jgi:hypothetical protein